MTRYFIILILIILSRNVSAQDYFFEFVDGWRNNYCFQQNGSYTYLGLDALSSSTNHQYLYNTLNANGNTINQITYFNDSTTSTTTRGNAYMAEWLDEENLLIAGTHSFDNGANQKGSLVKYNIATQEFELLGLYDEFFANQFYTISKAQDENFIISGIFNDGIELPDLQVLNTDTTGTVNWIYTSTCGALCSTRPQQVLSSTENEIYVLADEYDDSFPTFHERLSTVLIKTNEVGEQQWKISIGNHENFWINPGGIIEENDGILIFYSTPKYYDTDGEWHFNFDNSIHAEKYDFDGNLIEQYTLYEEIPHNIDFPQYEYEVFQVQKLNDGNYLLSGTDGYDGLMIKLSPNGELIWRRTHALYDENNNEDAIVQYTHLRNTIPTNDGGFMASGQYYSDPSTVFPNGIQTAIALKVDEFGCLEPGCHLIDGLGTIHAGLQNSIKVFPNPIKDALRIEWSLQAINYLNTTKNSQIIILDALGREIYKKKIGSNPISTIQLKQLPSGIYTLHWLNKNNWLDSVKIVKE